MKFSNPAGVIVYHNTIIAENRTAQRVSNAHFKNNLFLGTDTPVGIAVLGGPTAYSSYDYNGYRPNRAAELTTRGSVRKPGVQVDYDTPPDQALRFKTLADLAAATGQETHGSKSTTTSLRISVRQSRRIRRSQAGPTRPWISISG